MAVIKYNFLFNSTIFKSWNSKGCIFHYFTVIFKKLERSFLYYCGGCWNKVGSRAELRGMLVRAWRVCIYSTCTYHRVIWCRYVRLNALNVPHVPQPRFIAPLLCAFKSPTKYLILQNIVDKFVSFCFYIVVHL